MSFRWPVDNVNITQGFGGNAAYYKQFGQIGHNGIDIGVGTGTPVYAADEGVIYFEGWGQNHSWLGSPAGIAVLIDNGGVYSGYAHLMSTVVNKGQHVNKGQLIGYSDSTGAATGPHVHFEALPKAPNFQNGYAGRINPTPYIETTQTSQGGNSLMTPNFVRRTYWLVQGRDPSQGEVDFHVSKSSPESFINGFGDTPLWKSVSDQRDAAVNDRNNLAAVRDQLQTELNGATAENAPLKEKIKELDAMIVDKDKQIADLKKNSGGVDQDTKDKINGISAAVEWIKTKLSNIFK